MLSLLQWTLRKQSTLFMSHVTTTRLQLLAIPRVVNKLPALYENWRFSSMFTNHLQVPSLNQTHLFHICSSYSFWSHFNIIPPMPRSSKWFFSSDFLTKNPERISLLSNACYMSHVSNTSWSAILATYVEQYQPRSTSQQNFPHPAALPSSWVQIFSSAPISATSAWFC
jgi:hypothetical protein